MRFKKLIWDQYLSYQQWLTEPMEMIYWSLILIYFLVMSLLFGGNIVLQVLTPSKIEVLSLLGNSVSLVFHAGAVVVLLVKNDVSTTAEIRRMQKTTYK